MNNCLDMNGNLLAIGDKIQYVVPTAKGNVIIQGEILELLPGEPAGLRMVRHVISNYDIYHHRDLVENTIHLVACKGVRKMLTCQ